MPWDYAQLVAELAAHSEHMLDVGTGGGEQLASLTCRAPCTVATEAWSPNVPVAAQRLRPLGVHVVQVEPAPDNDEQGYVEQAGRLPFRDGSFDLVINRHESFVAREVARIMTSGAHFITQQVADGLAAELHGLLGLPWAGTKNNREVWSLTLARRQVEAAGLAVVRADATETSMWFGDVGALTWYLWAVPWEVPSFSPESHRRQLAALHERMKTDGPQGVKFRYFWLEAVKPS